MAPVHAFRGEIRDTTRSVEQAERDDVPTRKVADMVRRIRVDATCVRERERQKLELHDVNDGMPGRQ